MTNPPKKPRPERSVSLGFTVSPSVHRLLVRAAKAKRVTLGEFCRRAASDAAKQLFVVGAEAS